jgi:hypothetical protein
MIAHDDVPLALTSTVVQPDENGDYSFDVQGFLLPHEMMRREMARGERAVANMDCIKHPWKARAFAEWFIDFFNPIMYAHHDIEENIIFPFYFQLNVITPDRQAEDHLALIGRLNRVERACKRLLLLVEAEDMDTLAVKKEQDNIIAQFLDLCDHMREHFAEEEVYWPKILRKCGKENWDKIEPLLIEHALKFGDNNAGEPYRLMLCAIARSQGIQIGDDTFAAGETRWASKAFQEWYISTRPFYVRYIRMRAWNARYRSFRQLIDRVATVDHDENTAASTSPTRSATTAAVAVPPPPPPVMNHVGKFVSRTQKPLWPVYIFFYLSLFYVLCVGPYLAAISNPADNVKYLHIVVENMDEGFVGEYFLSYLANVSATETSIPSFHYRTGQTEHQLRNAVRDGEAWASVFVTANATAKLLDATRDGCAHAATYTAQDAIKFYWDEGRNNVVANPYIGGFLVDVLNDLSSAFAKTFVKRINASTVVTCLANDQEAVILQPIGYTAVNLSPVSVAPVVVNGGITIGNIYVAVFGASFIVNGAMGATAALAEDLSPVYRVGLRSATMLALGLGLSVCYATMIVAFNYEGSSEYLYSSDKWGQIFAVSWVHYTIWSFGHAWELETFGQALFPFFFGFLLLSSIIGGWNTDLADQGYKQFYQIFPFHWVIFLMRNIYYGTQEYRRGISAAILVSYAVVMMSGYIYTALHREFRNVGNKRYVHVEPLDEDEDDAADDEEKAARTLAMVVITDRDEDRVDVGDEAPLVANDVDDDNDNSNGPRSHHHPQAHHRYETVAAHDTMAAAVSSATTAANAL